MKTPSAQRNTLGLILFVVVAMGALVWYVILPLYDRILTTGDEIYELSATRESLRTSSTKNTQRAFEVREFESKLASFDRIYIQRANALSFITDLEGLARSSNVVMVLSLPDVQVTTAPIPIQLKIEAVGSFYALTSFLSSIERLSYYMNIHTLSFIPVSSLESNNQVKVSLTTTTYWR